MITKERKNLLRELWINETHEVYTQQWRKTLTKLERSLIKKWDVSYGCQLQKFFYNITKLQERKDF